ncbi:ArsR/SmtB family transcription factor [Limosilactobacillus fastidiosus]|uniref:Helix-turn-helix transcriptional regulator n=1 Tax=Limosilactobacillus fastidiosus TaxID=2759855 RepID=A0A7W3TYV7_9LACO|nr:metalloregulator ArsR/SmtB family transcription factor [Limosilactobacillus fastidiosus]MBB1063467.1 helix-turn-helix transcriptional regulator [Limosilactobacillus fastidiosus]MBB1085841.1 helix-turn-helix transcriptional regulator [Limosilactobacillus fastidiosus]MCD7084735.1 metalloregulator ArsR/SmtB family transcription factor [Limosilactobacillus fastidiosus]MCD7085822.1 metalloregulator ArsR/SmtB family transcription factor [Limosilactobacillus fastidiosus]MCD7113899.1 metalloregulat
MTPTSKLIDEATKIYKVLSNSTRIKILYYLRYQHQEVNVKTIVSDLGLAQPIISKQLHILYRYQLVCKRKEGTQVFYLLDDPHVVDMIDDMLNHVKHEIKGEPHPKNMH